MALDNGASVSLLYVADGIDEFEASWRLRRMAEMNPDVRLRIGIYVVIKYMVFLYLISHFEYAIVSYGSET